MYAERTDFGFDPDRFEPAYEELERALYEGRAVTTVVAPLLGIALDAEANADDGPRISTAGSSAAAWVIPTNEELMIARHTRDVLHEAPARG